MQVRAHNKKRGAALVEYGLLVAGVALVTAVAISIFGHKVNDMVGTAAAVLPSNDVEDTGAITGGRVVQTQGGSGSAISLGDTPEDTTMQDMFGTGVDTSGLIDDLQNP